MLVEGASLYISLKPSTFHSRNGEIQKLLRRTSNWTFLKLCAWEFATVVIVDRVTWTNYRRSPVSVMSLLLVSANQQAYIGKWKEPIDQGSATNGPQAGSGPTNKIIRPVAPFANCSDCMARAAARNCEAQLYAGPHSIHSKSQCMFLICVGCLSLTKKNKCFI